MNDSFSKQLREDLDQEQKKIPSQESIAQMLGFLGSTVTEIIQSDIGKMIDRGMRKEIDGYILSLSRIMRHDLAWKCILSAFSVKNESVPTKYYTQFNDTTTTEPTKPSSPFIVE